MTPWVLVLVFFANAPAAVAIDMPSKEVCMREMKIATASYRNNDGRGHPADHALCISRALDLPQQ